MPLIEGIVSSLIAGSISTGFRYREQIYKRLIWSIIRRNNKIRVSCSCLLKFQIDDEYLLIKNELRKDQFGPIGGAIKYFDSAKSFLDSIDFEPETHNKKKLREKIKRDMRGFIPANNLFKFIKWYVSGKDREENSLGREFKEELNEIELRALVSELQDIEFTKIRTISEGPHSVAGKSFFQFRLLTIYELSPNYINKQKLIDSLKMEADNNENLLLVDSNEIEVGMTKNGESIGAHSAFIIGERKYIKEDRSWSKKN